jgi:hypothetical protein
MRAVLLSAAILGSLAAEARADDAAAKIVGVFPDNTNGQHVEIFKLKENGITVRATPDEFCGQLGYGQAAKYQHTGKDGKVHNHILAGQGNEEKDEDGNSLFKTLDWVVCQFPKK